MKTLGIIQPGRIGDIILCLPIAKYYADRGYKVTWPIFSEYCGMFAEVVDYVHFIPITSDIYKCVSDAKIWLLHNDLILDLAATFPNSTCTDAYVKSGDGLGDIKADQFKYLTAEVPFKEKWNLSIKRNNNKEHQLRKQYIKQSNYVVSCLTTSQGPLNFKVDHGRRQLVEMNTRHSIFDWIGILIDAEVLVLSNSSVSNLVEMLNLSNKKYLLPRKDGRLPVLKNQWTII